MSEPDGWPDDHSEPTNHGSRREDYGLQRQVVGRRRRRSNPAVWLAENLFMILISLSVGAVLTALAGVYVGFWLGFIVPMGSAGGRTGAWPWIVHFATAGSIVGIWIGHELRVASFIRASYVWVPVSTAIWSSVATLIVSPAPPIGFFLAAALSVLVPIVLFALKVKGSPDATVSAAFVPDAPHYPRWWSYGFHNWITWNLCFPIAIAMCVIVLISIAVIFVTALLVGEVVRYSMLLTALVPIMFAVAGTIVGLGQVYWMREAVNPWAAWLWLAVSTSIWVTVAAYLVADGEPLDVGHVSVQAYVAIGFTLVSGVFLQAVRRIGSRPTSVSAG